MPGKQSPAVQRRKLPTCSLRQVGWCTGKNDLSEKRRSCVHCRSPLASGNKSQTLSGDFCDLQNSVHVIRLSLICNIGHLLLTVIPAHAGVQGPADVEIKGGLQHPLSVLRQTS